MYLELIFVTCILHFFVLRFVVNGSLCCRSIMSELSCLVYCFILLVLFSHQVNCDICSDTVCKYDFILRRHKTMTYTTSDSNGQNATYDVSLSGSNLVTVSNLFRLSRDQNVGLSLSSDDVITADGYSPRYVITINDQFPGPTIEVMQGAQVRIIFKIMSCLIILYLIFMHLLIVPNNLICVLNNCLFCMKLLYDS